MGRCSTRRIVASQPNNYYNKFNEWLETSKQPFSQVFLVFNAVSVWLASLPCLLLKALKCSPISISLFVCLRNGIVSCHQINRKFGLLADFVHAVRYLGDVFKRFFGRWLIIVILSSWLLRSFSSSYASGPAQQQWLVVEEAFILPVFRNASLASDAPMENAALEFLLYVTRQTAFTPTSVEMTGA